MRSFDATVSAAQRAVDVLGGGHPDAVTAIARVCTQAIEDGLWGALAWVPRPAELPDTDDDLHEAATSTKAADRNLRLAVLDWRFANEAVEVENAERLRVCVLNFRDLDALREQGDEGARALQVTIWVHARRTFNAPDLSAAPTGRDELARWCRCAVATKNPVPVWLRTGAAPRNAWRPSRGGNPTKASRLFTAPFNNDDDK